MRAHAFLCAICAAAGLVAVLASASCNVDEVHDQEVSALGSDSAPPGPTHRAGQPCLVCHGGEGPGKTQFSVAGTIYEIQGSSNPAVGTTVSIEDVLGDVCTATTNSAGNFFLTPSQCSPHFPIHPSLPPNVAQTQMLGAIGRAGSCAECHTLEPGPNSPGPVFLTAPDGGTLP